MARRDALIRVARSVLGRRLAVVVQRYSIADLGTLSTPLAARGYTPADIDNIFAGNFLRFLKDNLK